MFRFSKMFSNSVRSDKEIDKMNIKDRRQSDGKKNLKNIYRLSKIFLNKRRSYNQIYKKDIEEDTEDTNQDTSTEIEYYSTDKNRLIKTRIPKRVRISYTIIKECDYLDILDEYFNDDKSSLYSDKSDMETICLPQKNRLSQLILDLDLYIYQMKY